jgi:hypothetical protein
MCSALKNTTKPSFAATMKANIPSEVGVFFCVHASSPSSPPMQDPNAERVCLFPPRTTHHTVYRFYSLLSIVSTSFEPLAIYSFSRFNQQQRPISVEHPFSWPTSATHQPQDSHEIPPTSARRRLKEDSKKRNCQEFEANSGKPEFGILEQNGTDLGVCGGAK